MTASGKQDIGSGPQLEQLRSETAGSTVVLDLSGLDFVDSVGIATLIRTRRRIAEAGNQIVFRGPLKVPVGRIFRMTH